MKTFRKTNIIAALTLFFMTAFISLNAQIVPEGLCARVKIQIAQELTLERIGFEATLEVTNNDGEDPLTEFSARLFFRDPSKSPDDPDYDAGDLFFVQQPVLEHINRIDGSGLIGPTRTAVVRWFIIPKIDAGGTDPRGKIYTVGCELAANIRGEAVPAAALLAIPEQITVVPDAQLDITYFQPRYVTGDDPFTPEVESSIPFPLGVLVRNFGYGPANDLNIRSQQPRIVENYQGLLLVARLLGVRVMDQPLDETSLTVNLGDIPPGQARKGVWDMITTLSGTFVEFKATFSHAPELGGEETSVIRNMEAHFIIGEVINDEPGRDDVRDFLADTNRDGFPDTLYETDGPVLPVNLLQQVEAGTLSGASLSIQLDADREGWGYFRIDDPAQGRLVLQRVVRSDGKVLHPANAWLEEIYIPGYPQRQYLLHVFDRVDIGEWQYDVTYAPAAVDTDPPVTRLRFSGEVTEVGGVYYITPQTQIFFTAEDANPVNMYYRIDDEEFRPALPFNIHHAGTFRLEYYSRDIAGNIEIPQVATLVIPGEGPAFVGVGDPGEALFLHGGMLSVRSGKLRIGASVAPNPLNVDASVAVYPGVHEWTDDPDLFDPGEAPAAVRQWQFPGIAGDAFQLDWDGRDNAGRLLPAGWYGVLMTVEDSLGALSREAYAVYISELASARQMLASSSQSPRNPHARGAWAVWQQRSPDGNWNIHARELEAPEGETIALTQSTLSQENPRTDGRYAVWQGRRSDGSWSVYFADLLNPGSVAEIIAADAGVTAIQPAIDWPWVVYAARPKDQPAAPWQIEAFHLVDQTRTSIHPGPADQRNPAVHAGRVAWQDLRDPGAGEIYFANLETGAMRRITHNQHGQYHPAIRGDWLAWQDNRHGTVEIYGYHLLGDREMRLTESAGNKARPFIDGDWLLFEDDAFDPESGNFQLLDLNSGGRVPLTYDASRKTFGALVAGQLLWQEGGVEPFSLHVARLPALQAVAGNRNLIAVTESMANRFGDAFSLLADWQASAGVTHLSRCSALLPEPVWEEARWEADTAEGENFALEANGFIWVEFAAATVLDLGDRGNAPIGLNAGINALVYDGFPSDYSAYRLISDLGSGSVAALRMLDAASGFWRSLEVTHHGEMIGADFSIPTTAVLLVTMREAVGEWRPRAQLHSPAQQ